MMGLWRSGNQNPEIEFSFRGSPSLAVGRAISSFRSHLYTPIHLIKAKFQNHIFYPHQCTLYQKEKQATTSLKKSTLENWIKSHKASKLCDTRSMERPLVKVEEELARIKRELVQVNQERDILRKRIRREHGIRCKQVKKFKAATNSRHTLPVADNLLEQKFVNELVYHQKYETRKEAKKSITEYIEIFYNRQRKQARLGYLSPTAFQRKFFKEQSYG